MKNIEKAFANHTHVDKIRIAKFVTQTIVSNHELIKAHDGTMNTVLGLLAKGDINCAGNAIDPNGDLFGNTQKTTQPIDRKPRQATETDPGVIRTQREKEQADEIKRRQEEEEERLKKEEEAKKKEEEERIRKENSFWNKALKGIKQFGKSIVEEE
jgi:cell division protein FtsA